MIRHTKILHAASDDTNLMFSRVSQKRAGQALSTVESRFCETRLNIGLLAALCLNGRRAEYNKPEAPARESVPIKTACR